MSSVISFPIRDDEPEWVSDASEVEEGYSVDFLRRDVLVCREWFRTYPEVTAAARAIHLTHDADVRILLTPESEVPQMAPRNIDELLFQMPSVESRASDPWVKSFAASILKQRRRRNWRPTEKQVAIMRRLVAELFGEPEDITLVEEDDT